MTVQSDTFRGSLPRLQFERASREKEYDTAPSRVACQEPDWVERQISAEAQNQIEGNDNLQNTKTEYCNSERTPVVLPEMEQLLPPLSVEQFSALERDILENGCYAPIIVNENMVIVFLLFKVMVLYYNV